MLSRLRERTRQRRDTRTELDRLTDLLVALAGIQRAVVPELARLKRQVEGDEPPPASSLPAGRQARWRRAWPLAAALLVGLAGSVPLTPPALPTGRGPRGSR